jgi:hypothetical protein
MPPPPVPSMPPPYQAAMNEYPVSVLGDIQEEQWMQGQFRELMKLYHLCCKNGMYKEAEKIARTAYAVYPENPAAQAAIHVAKLLAKKDKSLTTKHAKKARTLTMPSTCPTSTGPQSKANAQKAALPIANVKTREVLPEPVAAPSMPASEIANVGTPEMLPMPREVSSMPKVLSKREICQRLSDPVSVNFKDTGLAQVIDDLREITGINIVLDDGARTDISLDQHVSLQRQDVSLKAVLNTLLDQVHLTYVVRDGSVVITPEK